MNYHSWMLLEKSAPIFGYGLIWNKTVDVSEEYLNDPTTSSRIFTWINNHLVFLERKQENRVIRNQKDCCQS